MKQILFNKYIYAFLFSSMIFLFGGNLQAQEEMEEEEQPRFFFPKIVDISQTYIGAHFGLASPMDDFRRVSPAAESGFAKTGYKFGLDGSFIFFRNMGLGWTFGYAVNPIDEAAYLREIHWRLPKSIDLIDVTGNVSAGKWNSTWLTIGPYISLPEEKFMFDFGMYLGLAYTNMPKISFIGETNGQFLTNEVLNDGAISAAFLMQGSGNWFLKDNIRVFAKGEMMFSRPELRQRVTTEMETFLLTSSADEKQAVGLLSLMIGVAYEFENKKSAKSSPKRKSQKAMAKKKKKFLKKK